MIKLGNNDISLKVGSANVSAAYLGDVQVYGGGGYDLCYGVADDINTYSARTFADVFDKTSGKWYKLNNLNEYEEYGVYGSGRNITTYVGKLTIDDGYEYKYTGGTWVNIGAVSATTATLPNVPFSLNINARNYDANTKTFPKTQGQLADTDFVITTGTPTAHDDYVTVANGTKAVVSGYQTYFNRDASSPNLTIITKQKTSSSTYCHLFSNRSGSSDYNWMYRPTDTKLAFHGSSQINGTNTTTQPVIEGIRVDSGLNLRFDNFTDNTTTTVPSFTYGRSSNSVSLFFGGSTTGSEYFAGDFYWIYVSQETLTDEQVQAVINYNENGSTTEYPEYYADKADPLNSLTFNTLAEAEAYAYTNCVYDGMVAKIGGVRYVFDSTDGWVEHASYAEEYLTFAPKESCTFSWSGTTSNNAISYSTDNGATWSTPAQTATVTTAGNVLWKGTFTPSSSNPYGSGKFTTSGQFDVEGNIMSLLYGDNFSEQTSLGSASFTFHNLFNGCTGITSAENLILPATTLVSSCYSGMFGACTALTTVPALPATTMANGCYSSMFANCYSLTTAPELSGTTAPDSCYYCMFLNCSGMTTAPSVLSATTVGSYSYQRMFGGCTSLTTAPVISGTSIGTSGCSQMFQGCTSLTTAPALPATTLGTYCYGAMFEGCTSLTTAPELPATTLANSCYVSMFENCTSLTTAPALPATTLGNSCYSKMFNRCTSLTTPPPVLSASSMSTSACTYMFSGCTSLTTAPELPATTVDKFSYSNMFYGCTGLTSAPSVLPANSPNQGAYSLMFYNCKSLTTSPLISASTLNRTSCAQMFKGCSSLNSITCLATSISATNCTYIWVDGVASSGIFTKADSMNDWTTGSSGIPSNWTVQDYTT